MTAESDEDEEELVACPECGREGLAARIEDTRCPHYRPVAHQYRGP